MNVQEAIVEDIKSLAIHHRKIFEEIWERKRLKLEDTQAKELESAYIEKVSKQIPEGVCKAWVIKDGDRIIASGAISIVSLVPVPNDLKHQVAYMHSIYTEKAHRNKKCAQKIVDKAIQYCKHNGVNRIFLNASEAGKPIYDKKGFESSPETMRLFIK